MEANLFARRFWFENIGCLNRLVFGEGIGEIAWVTMLLGTGHNL